LIFFRLLPLVFPLFKTKFKTDASPLSLIEYEFMFNLLFKKKGFLSLFFFAISKSRIKVDIYREIGLVMLKI